MSMQPHVDDQSGDDLHLRSVLPLVGALLGSACGFFSGMPLALSHVASHSFMLGVTPLLASILILYEALRVRRQSFLQLLLAAPTSKLATGSVYGISRHAGRAALAMALGSSSICLNSWWGCIFACILIAAWNTILVPKIDERNAARFGLAHKLHCERTATWI